MDLPTFVVFRLPRIVKAVSMMVFVVAVIVLAVASPRIEELVAKLFGLTGGAHGYDLAQAVFSALAFACVFYALMLQRRELALQREELSQTRRVMESQEQQMERQGDLIDMQAFEATFFNLLRRQRETAASVSLANHVVSGYGSLASAGVKTFGSLCDAIYVLYGQSRRQGGAFEFDYRAYKITLEDHGIASARHELRTAVTSLQAIIELVDKKAGQDKAFYFRILAAQLTPEELTLSFYLLIHWVGADDRALQTAWTEGLFSTMSEDGLLHPSNAQWLKSPQQYISGMRERGTEGPGL